MGQVTIKIDKREYAIACEDGQEAHIIQLSRILDEKARMLSKSIGLVNENMMLAMVGLLLADENQEILKNGGAYSADDMAKFDAQNARAIETEVARLGAIIKDIKQQTV